MSDLYAEFKHPGLRLYNFFVDLTNKRDTGCTKLCNRIQLLNGSPNFIGNGYSVALTADRSHLTDPTQLMSRYLAPA